MTTTTINIGTPENEINETNRELTANEMKGVAGGNPLLTIAAFAVGYVVSEVLGEFSQGNIIQKAKKMVEEKETKTPK